MADTIQFVLDVRERPGSTETVHKLNKEIDSTGGHIKKIGDESDRSSKKVGNWDSALKRAVTGLAALGAGFAVWKAAKGAVEYTANLTKSTNMLTKATGMSVEQSSRWAAVAGAMGVEGSKLGMMFTKLSTAAEAQIRKTGTQVTAFDRLHISTKQAKDLQHDMAGMLGLVTDKINEMQSGTDKASIYLALFGRGWQSLNPLLREGSKGIKEWMDTAKRFGVEITGGTTKEMTELVHAQKEWQLATDGLRLAFVKIAAKPLTDLLSGFARTANYLRKGDWANFGKEVEKGAEGMSKVTAKVMPKIADAFGKAAPRVAMAFVHGFASASFPGQALLGAMLLTKLGITGALGRKAGGIIAGGVAKGLGSLVSLASGAIKRFAAWLLGSSTASGAAAGAAESSAMATTMSSKASLARLGTIGRMLGRAAMLGLAAYVVANAPAIWESLLQSFGIKTNPKDFSWGQLTGISPQAAGPSDTEERAKLRKWEEGSRRANPNAWRNYPRPKAAQGGLVRQGGVVEVGEKGRELAWLPTGTTVTPLGQVMRPFRDIVLKVDGRVLARVSRREVIQAQAAG